MMKRIVLIVSFFNFLIVAVGAQTLTGRAPAQVAVGEQFRLSYTVNTDDVKGFRAGNIPDAFDVLMGPSTSTQSSFQMVNGHTSSSTSVTYTYILSATKNGTFTIPAAHVTAGGKNIQSNELHIKVSGEARSNGQGGRQQNQQSGTGEIRPSGTSISGSDLFIKVTASKQHVREQEPILLTYKVYTLVGLTQLNGKMADLKSFYTREVPLPQEKQFHIENFNGAYADGMIVSIFNQTEVTDEEMSETNNLCSAIIGERHDVAISNVSFTDFELEAGAKKALSIDVKNKGTTRISNFTITVYNGEDVVAQKVIEKTLKTGETTNVELEITLPKILEKTTYVVEVEETDYDDSYVADNSYELTVGRAALMVNAESSPTDSENIVIVTVENNGYEPSGGMVALFDDQNQVKEVLVENFDPIGHDESYTCAIKLNDEYFEGASGKTFNIGVVPLEEQDINAYNITTLYVDNINNDNLPNIDISNINIVETLANEEISLMEETGKSIKGKVTNESDNDRGIYLDMICLDTIRLAAGEESEFTAEYESMENVAIIKVLLINNDSLVPLSSAVEIRLYDDLTDDDEGIDESEEYDTIINTDE